MEQEKEDLVEEEVTEVSSIPVYLMKPYSGCMEEQETLPGTQAPVAPQGTGSIQSPCRPSLYPLCRAREEPASWPLLCLQRSP